MMQYTMLWGGEYVKNINVQDKTWGMGTTYHKWLIANTETLAAPPPTAMRTQPLYLSLLLQPFIHVSLF